MVAAMKLIHCLRTFVVFLVLAQADSACVTKHAGILHISENTLSNGLKMFVNENHKLPIVSVNLFIPGGTLAETKAKAGISKLLVLATHEGSQFKAAEKEMSDIGADIDFLVSADGFFLSVAGLKEDLSSILRFMAKIAGEPGFEQEDVEKARGLLLDGLREKGKDLPALGQEKFLKSIYGDQPFGWGTEEYKKSFKVLKYDDVINYHRRYFLPNNMILAVSGDVNPKEVFEKSNEMFGSWKAAKIEFPKWPEVKRENKTHEIFIKSNDKQSYIYFGHMGVTRSNPDYYALQTADAILETNGLISRIPNRIISKEGLAYNVGASFTGSAGVVPGYFEVNIETSTSRIREIVHLLKQEISTLQGSSVSEEELQQAKSYLTGTYYFSFQSNDEICAYIIESQVYGLPLNLVNVYPSLINSVTAAQIQATAKQYFDLQNYTLVVISHNKL